MTNQQGAPEALRHADGLESFARMLPAYGFDPQPLKDAAATVRSLHAIALELADQLSGKNERLAALVEAQQPALSAAGAQTAQRLRAACLSVRTKSYPLSDLIPLMQEAADALTVTPTPQADRAPVAICNACGADLLEVKQSPNSYLSAEQFDADKLGDWYCKCCPKGPSEGSSTHRYFWNRDLGAAAPQADSQPAPVADVERLDPSQPLHVNLAHLAKSPKAAIEVFGAEWAGWCAASAIDALRAARAPADSVTAPAGAAIHPQIQATLAKLDVPVRGYLSSHSGTLHPTSDKVNSMESAVPLVSQHDHRNACETIIKLLSAKDAS